ncbi:class I SAM-dependent methyltransferase [Solibacillus sp. FSL K6-1523]|uniref:class I SAM-dependent methyltransferase n=1 Tax=Solibacillus sp. FSL K6-1523 TaxID=2921471 RepID=UPI0030FA3350
MNEQQYEKQLNINTSGFQYGFPKLVKYHRYEPTPYSGLDQLFEHYTLPENACLVDIGCGKGRVPIYVHYQFQIPVVGIEMDQKFFIEAEHNREQYLKKNKKNSASIQFMNQLAETYKIADKDNVFFFFNPFSIHVFRQVMNHILDSLEQKKRVIDVILYYPAPEYMLYLQQELALNFLVEVKLADEKNENERIVVFRIS